MGSQEHRDAHPGSERWVRQLYLDLLLREGDPAGLQEHVADLALTADVPRCVRAFVSCDEHHERWVEAAWRRFLGRDPTPAEVARLAAGEPLESTWLRAPSSAEYLARADGRGR